MQELGYGSDHNYREGSPHLSHWSLYDRLSGLLRQAIREAIEDGLAPTVLEVGAGHGGYTEVALAAGARVFATEMSRPSVNRLTDRFGTNPGFRAVFDPDGSLSVLGRERFSIVMCSSVLHHIPDYLGFLEGPMIEHLSPKGSFFSVQDPLWYPAVGPTVRRVSRWTHLLWRATKGNYRQGFATLSRRVRRVYDPANPADMVEYHVVRNGVDHEAIERLLTTHFRTCEIGSYWSTPSPLFQRLGEWFDRPNTFFVWARDYQPVNPGGISSEAG